MGSWTSCVSAEKEVAGPKVEWLARPSTLLRALLCQPRVSCKSGWVVRPLSPVLPLSSVMLHAGNSSKAPGEGAEMGNVALAAAVNLPMLTELLLDKQQAAVDSASVDGDSNNPVADALQQTKPLLVGAATAVASAAIALAGSQPQLQQQLQEDAARDKQDAPASVVATANAVAEAHTPEEVMGMLEEEIRAMIALLDGSALDDHLEPLYLSSIAAAIKKLRELREQ